MYYPGYGYVTSYEGKGIFGDLFSLAQQAITSDAAKNIAVEAGKSFAKTAGTKAGEKLVDKVFKEKKVNPTDIMIEKPKNDPNDIKVEKKKKPIKDIKLDLDEIYGNGLFRMKKHVGKGLKRL